MADARRTIKASIPVIAVTLAATVIFLAILAAGRYAGKPRSQKETPARVAEKLEHVDASTRQKICAHRSNTVPKYRSARDLFRCLELDVVVEPPDGGRPAVYHPPDENYHGLTLQFLLGHELLPAGKLWLDVKDLSASNWQFLLELLSTLVDKAKRGDVIVETSWADESVKPAADAFREAGFLFSYYLPTDEAIACNEPAATACDAFRSRVVRTLALGFTHLSFDANAYGFVTSIRPALPKGLGLLTWDLSSTWPNLELARSVDVYLVRYRHPCST